MTISRDGAESPLWVSSSRSTVYHLGGWSRPEPAIRGSENRGYEEAQRQQDHCEDEPRKGLYLLC